jgi:hypothetical protein
MPEDTLDFDRPAMEVLKRGPLYMLAHIGGADSHVDAAEWVALIDAVITAANVDDRLTRGVLGPLSQSLHAGAKEIPDGRVPLDGLREIARVLESWPDDAGRAYRETLIQIGAAVAEASGSQLTRTFLAHHGQAGWVRSGGTSAHEREALQSAAEALGLGS